MIGTLFVHPITFEMVVGIVAGVISFTAHPLYIIAILKKETVPHVMTWFLSALLAGVALFMYSKAGAEETVYVLIGDFIGFSVITVLAFRLRDQVTLSWEDWTCFGGALISIIVYVVFNDAFYAFIATLIAEVLALWPTIRKTFQHPEQEDFIAWTFTFVGNLLNFFAMANRIEVLYVTVIFIADGIVWSLILRGRKKL